MHWSTDTQGIATCAKSSGEAASKESEPALISANFSFSGVVDRSMINLSHIFFKYYCYNSPVAKNCRQGGLLDSSARRTAGSK